MFLVLFILSDPDKLEDLLNAWESIGITRVTILHSSGLGRMRLNHASRDDLPLVPSLESLLQHEEFFGRTLFAAIDDENWIEPMLGAAQRVVGNLSQPNTGLMVVLPVHRAYGLEKQGD